MTDIERNTIDNLVSLGFETAVARIMVRFCGLPCPLTDNIRNNIDLLCRYLEPGSILIDNADQMARFLKRDYSENSLMESIPDRYEFSGSERAGYYTNPLAWSITCDLRTELDDTLKCILPHEQQRMSIYRGMYCKGVWWGCETIIDICKVLLSIAPDSESLEKIVFNWWGILFSYYSGTIQYAETLKAMFVPEHVWEVFCDNIMNVREFTEHFKLFDRRETIIDDLKEKFEPYLNDLR